MNGTDWKKFLEGKTIREATRPLHLYIETRHIKKAEPGNPCNCVIAVCAKEQLGEHVDSVIVKQTVVYVQTGDILTRYRLYDKPLRKAIKDFDFVHQWTIKPGRYTLSVPVRSHTQAYYNERWEGVVRPKWTGGRGKPRKKQIHVITRHFRLAEVTV